MNPIDDLIKLLTSNPSLKDQDLQKSFPQLNNPDLVRRARAYVAGKRSGEYNDNALDENFSDVLGAMQPKSEHLMFQNIPKEQINADWSKVPSVSQKQNPQNLEQSEDPLGDVQTNLLNQHSQIKTRQQEIQNIYGNRDNTSVVHPQLNEIGNEVSNLNGQQNYLQQSQAHLNSIVQNGAPVPTLQATNSLQELVSKKNPQADITKMPVEEIQKYTGGNLTAQAYLKTLDNSRKVYDAFHNSPTLEDAALKWARNDPKQASEIDQQTNGTNDPSLVSPAQMGSIVNNFLQQPAAKEWAHLNQQNLNAYQSASTNLVNHYKDFGSSLVASKISQELEDSGHNNGILNRIPSDLDQRMQQWVKEGKISPQEYQLYQQKKPDVILKIQTPGLLENAAGGFKDIIANGLTGLAESERSLVGASPDAGDQLFDKNQEKYQQVPFEPKGFLHGLAKNVGEFGGQAAGLAILGGAFKGLGLPSSVANGVSFALSAEHPLRQQALDLFPDDPDKRTGYVTLMMGVNAALGGLVSREKAVEGLGKILSKGEEKSFQDVVLNTINDFTEGKITSDAAKESIQGTFKGLLQKIPEYGKAALKHNLSMSAQMAALTGVQDAADVVFGAKEYSPEDMGTSMLSTAKLAFLSGSPLSFLAAHADITSASKIASSAVYEMASDPLRYKTLIENLAATDNKFSLKTSDMLHNLDLSVQVKSEMDSNPQFDGLSSEDKQKYLFQSLSQKILEENLKTTTDNVLKKKLKEQIKQSEAFNDRLLTGAGIELKELSKADQEAGIKSYHEDQKNIPDLVQKIVKGHPLSDEDLQLQKNFPDKVESQLNDHYKSNQDAVQKQETNVADVRTPSTNSAEVGKGDETQGTVNKEASPKEELNYRSPEEVTKLLGDFDKTKKNSPVTLEGEEMKGKEAYLKLGKQYKILDKVLDCL